METLYQLSSAAWCPRGGFHREGDSRDKGRTDGRMDEMRREDAGRPHSYSGPRSRAGLPLKGEEEDEGSARCGAERAGKAA